MIYEPGHIESVHDRKDLDVFNSSEASVSLQGAMQPRSISQLK